MFLAWVTSAIADGLPNAWEISDISDAMGSGELTYSAPLTAAQQAAATDNGWRYSINVRLLDDLGGSQTMAFGCTDGIARFAVLLALDPNTNLVVTLPGADPQLLALTTNGIAAAKYHTHDLVYDPGMHQVSYQFDGSPVAAWQGQTLGTNGVEVLWGAESSVGTGRMRLHRAEFAIVGLGTGPLYDAGTERNPPTAPNPVTQGWFYHGPDLPGAVTNGPVSPDNPAYWFTDIGASLKPLLGSFAAWGDYNKDGLLDLVISGYTNGGTTVPVTLLYQNHGRGELIPASGILSALGRVGGPSWIDINNDGLLDISLGDAAQPTPVLFRNSGGTSFVKDQSTGFLSRFGGGGASMQWADYDNDGFLDVLVWGGSKVIPGTYACEIYRSIGGTSFLRQTNIVLRGLGDGSAAWCDYNRDGYPDFVITGTTRDNALHTDLYLNQGGTNFVRQSRISLLGVASYGSVAWGDFNNDGYPDLLVSGRADAFGVPRIVVYRNSQAFAFIKQAELPGVFLGSAVWGDFDNDGFLDIAVTGYLQTGGTGALIYRNIGGTSFRPQEMPSGPSSVAYGSAVWGDYDNDGDLDLAITGIASGTAAPSSSLLRNNTPVVNTPP